MFSSTRASKVVLAAVLASSLVGGVVMASSATAAGSPTIKITPAKGLKNGQKVTVTGSGFTPKDNVYIVECLKNSTGQADCNALGAVPAVITAKGKLPATSFTVATGTIGPKTCGTSKADANGCNISVGNPSGADSTTTGISFVVPGKK